MGIQNKLDIKVDYTYVEEVFESQGEYKHFLQIMCFEFEEAIDKLVLSIEKQDIHSYRKTLHNVIPHLDMLRAYELSQFLEQLKPSVGNPVITQVEKEEMVTNLRLNFEKVVRQVKNKCEQISTSS
ncbi:hypothetical protein [Catalinimonas niigatensis]|uniref:hypothetical protein n=1 Tax=Catalinimonas niigatensis TaxID=1397264 RepID=UPI0026656941|nr:hypothetical protein [Catalinimonas niigatensis]WPP52802.1 hypothetical protein PZB72_10475 [Catalinimonas niigatensis]